MKYNKDYEEALDREAERLLKRQEEKAWEIVLEEYFKNIEIDWNSIRELTEKKDGTRYPEDLFINRKTIEEDI
tara:strand:+ start:38573 stop:38791 length:219 start_codon:yes stop_codon:yes gene_type:complete